MPAKSRKSKKSNTGGVNKLLVYASALFLIIIVALVAYIFRHHFIEGPDEPTKPVVEQPIQYTGQIFREVEPVTRGLQLIHERGASRSEVFSELPQNTRVEIFNENITADQTSEYVLYRINPELPRLQRRLQREDYVGQVEGLLIYKVIDDKPQPVFSMTQTDMKNHKGEKLVGQIEAKYGYAVKVIEYSNQEYYRETVKLITIIILDEKGNAASDGLTIYWDPGPRKYKATNTFGAPGTFE